MKSTTRIAILTAPLLAAIFVLPLHAAPAGLIAHYKLDETSGTTATDSTGLSTNGVLSRFPTNNSEWVPGKIGGALNFGGPDDTLNGGPDYVIASNYPKPTTAMTVTAWVNARSRSWWGSVVKNWGDSSDKGQFHFGINDNPRSLGIHFRTTAGDFSIVDSTLIPLDQWEFVAFTAGGSTLRLYRDGIIVASTAYTGSFVNPAIASLGIGVKTNDTGLAPATEPGNAPGYWDGKLDDIGIWNTALTTSEINAIYQAGLQGRDLEHVNVPEPSSIALLALGLGLLLAFRARRGFKAIATLG